MPLDPEFDRRIRALVTAGQSGGKSLNFESVYRSPQDQARAINSVSMNVNKRPASIVDYARGIPGYAAPVGSSMHQKGLAADLAGGGVGWARENAANYGIRFPESLRGTDPNHAEIDPKFWGPVQDPRDAAATAAAASAPPIKVAEIPARMGGTDVAPASTSSPAPSAARVASYSNSTGAAPAMAQSYSGWTPESVDFAKKFGASQMKEGIDSSPVGHWTQAIARVLQAGSGAAWNQQGMEGERAGNARVADIYSNALANNEPTSRIAAQLMADPFGRAKGMALAEREPDRAMERQRMQLATNADQRAANADRRQTELSTMQMQQLKSQTPEWRQANAARFGIDIATPEGKAFVISGQYTPKSNQVTLNEGQTIGNIVPGADGNSTFKPIVQGAEKPPAEHTSKAANFAARMIEAERNTRKLLDGIDPIDGTKGKKFGAADKDVALTAPLPEAVRNMVISGEHQQYRQAAEQWIRAFLRKESGAAIGADEFKRDFVVYFPQPGDGPEVIKQKAVARASAMSGIASEAGSYFEKKNPEAAKHLNVYKGGAQPTPQADHGGQPRRVNSVEEAMSLPSGTQFMTPDGRLKVRP